MHQLFVQVLTKRDLSRAGDLFSLEDKSIEADLSELIYNIQQIANQADFVTRHNDQSVVEICLTRITSAIRDTGSIEKHAGALVSLLDSCLNHDLKPSIKDEDPPHAKIASDVVSCIFLNHSKRSVMKLAVPIAVKLLHRGNKELSRNLSSYLSLAAINNADILSPHVQPIIDSIIGGNYSLARVLPKIYAVNKDPIHDHVMALVSLLPQCETPEKLSLLNLFALISKNKPSILESHLPQLSECLTQSQTAYPTLQIFLDMAQANPKPVADLVPKVVAACEPQNGMLSLAAQFLSIIGKLNMDRARDCLTFLVTQLCKSDLSTTITLLREIKTIGEVYPSILPSFLPQIKSQCETSSSSTVHSYLQQLTGLTSGVPDASSITVVRVNCDNNLSNLANLNSLNGSSIRMANSNCQSATPPSSLAMTSPTRGNSIISDSSSTRSPQKFISNNMPGVMYRSIPRLHIVSGGHIIGRHLSGSSNLAGHRSMTALQMANFNSRQSNMNRMSVESVVGGQGPGTPTGSQKSASSSYLLALEAASSVNHSTSPASKTVATSIDSQLQQAQTVSPHGGLSSVAASSSSNSSHYNLNHRSSRSELNAFSTLSSKSSPDGKNGTSSLNGNSFMKSSRGSPSDQAQLSNSLPYPMRDAVQHFCEKHIDKIKAYMQKIFVKLPLPVKCVIDEKKMKKVAKLHFICQGKSSAGKDLCLYQKSFFIVKTRNARLWIHLMFLALQAKASSPLSTREAAVQELKDSWDTLKADNRTFLTLVTSSFPSAKDQDVLMAELRVNRYFDVFEFNAIAGIWGCFLCNHPERATGFLQGNEPVIEGQLKEKKGKWNLFRRWRTRYFTLSGMHLSYRETKESKDGQPIEVGEIRSVRAIGSRGRSIPKAFEIFTNDKTYVLKAKNSKNTEQWVQCLSIAMAQSQSKDTKE